MTATDPETFSWARLLLACGTVGGLLAALGFGLKELNKRGASWLASGSNAATRKETKRLAIMESLPLDIKRRLVVVRCDDSEHLLLLGLNQDIVISTNIDSRRAETTSQAPHAR